MMDWDREYEELMALARENLDPELKFGQAVVLKTETGKLFTAMIPDFTNPEIRVPIENRLLERLTEENETRVLRCLCTTDGQYPIIPSRHLMDRLVEINCENLQTVTFLWGGEDIIHAKPFSCLLPAK